MNADAILISADSLAAQLGTAELVLVDLQASEGYLNAHIPGAVHLNYSELVRSDGQAGGLLPTVDAFSAVARTIGICAGSRVVAYDAQGGAAAARLIWTLRAYGHNQSALLDGGLHHWAAQGHPLEQGNQHVPSGDFSATTPARDVIDGDALLARLGDPALKVLDARSAAEFAGTKVLAARGGHIPGACHLEWSEALDPANSLRFKPDDELLALLHKRGIERSDEVVVHCQTHHRSSLSYVMLKHLGFAKVLGYHGSWSEWGNRSDTPIET